jgi:hypothetical protein
MKKIRLLVGIFISLAVVVLLTRTLLLDWAVLMTGTDRHAPEIYDGDIKFYCLVCDYEVGDYVVVFDNDLLLVEKVLDRNESSVIITSPAADRVAVPVNAVIGVVL